MRVWIGHWTVIGLKERERELMLLKLYSIIFCTDLVIDIDIDLERKFILPRGTQESQLVKTLNVKKKKKVEKLLKKSIN